MSESKKFIIKIQAGSGHQEYASLFSPAKIVGLKMDGLYGIMVDAELLQMQLPDGVQMPKTRRVERDGVVREVVHIRSKIKPMMATRERDGTRVDGPTATMDFFERYFHDLHWIGLTPDRVIRYVSKEILMTIDLVQCGHYDTEVIFPALLGVMMNRAEIVQAIEDLHKQRTSELDL